MMKQIFMNIYGYQYARNGWQVGYLTYNPKN